MINDYCKYLILDQWFNVTYNLYSHIIMSKKTGKYTIFNTPIDLSNGPIIAIDTIADECLDKLSSEFWYPHIKDLPIKENI